MICAPTAARPASEREHGPEGRERGEDGADDHIAEKGESKVFELLEGGTATAEARKEKAQCLCDRANAWRDRAWRDALFSIRRFDFDLRSRLRFGEFRSPARLRR